MTRMMQLTLESPREWASESMLDVPAAAGPCTTTVKVGLPCSIASCLGHISLLGSGWDSVGAARGGVPRFHDDAQPRPSASIDSAVMHAARAPPAFAAASLAMSHQPACRATGPMLTSPSTPRSPGPATLYAFFSEVLLVLFVIISPLERVPRLPTHISTSAPTPPHHTGTSVDRRIIIRHQNC